MNKKFLLRSFALSCALAAIVLVACNKEETSLPKLTITSVSDITANSVIVVGNIAEAGNPAYTERGICYASTAAPTIDDAKKESAGTGTGEFTVTLTDLTSNATYYVRAYAISSEGVAYSSNEVSFETLIDAMAPQLSTAEISEITATTATAGGNITDAGTPAYTVRGVCFATTASPTIDDSKAISEGGGIGDFTVALTNLTPNTTYYARAYATNSNGTAYGNEVSFETLESGITAHELTRPVYIDFGRADNPSLCSEHFNGFLDPAAGALLPNLKDDEGTNTQYAIKVASEGFNDFLLVSWPVPNVFGFNWCVANDMFFNDGGGAAINPVPESGFIISNLRKGQSYDFYLWGNLNDPFNIETEYYVEGENNVTLILDISFNQARNIAVAEAITPNDDGEVIIRMKQGPNNNHVNGFYGINSMIITPTGYDLGFEDPVSEYELTRPIYIDFGLPDRSDPPFNDFAWRLANSALRNLRDDQWNSTGYSLTLLSEFWDIARDLPNEFGFPWQVSNDMLFRDGDNPNDPPASAPESSFVISNMKKSQSYKLHFYCHINDLAVETEYSVAGATTESVLLDCSNNHDRLAAVTVTPNADGELVVTLRPGPNNTQFAKFYGINAMIITPAGYDLTFPLEYE